MQKDLNLLKFFHQVVISGSFTKAASALRSPKSKISRSISALESEVGVQLFYRTTRKLQLTPAGKTLFEKSAPLFTELEATLENLNDTQNDVSGLIRMSVPEDTGVELLGGICKGFLDLHPRVTFHLDVSNRLVDLIGESFDLALRVGPISGDTLIQRSVGEIHMEAVMSPKLYESFNSPERLEELEKIPYLAFQAEGMEKRIKTVFISKKERRALKLNPLFSSTNFFLLRTLAIQGLGFGILPPYLVREQIKNGELVSVFSEWTTDKDVVHLVLPPQKKIPLRIKKWMDYLTLRLKTEMCGT